jgi:hypothetical protein
VQGVTSTVGGISAKDKRAQELAEKAKKVSSSRRIKACLAVQLLLNPADAAASALIGYLVAW